MISAHALRLRRGVGATLSALALAGCAEATPHPGSPDRREPDGVAVDPPGYPPDAVDRADARAGVVTLRTPLGIEAARDAARSFLIAISNEDSDMLRQRLTPDALSLNPSSRARENAFYFFSRRFARLEYQSLAGSSFFQDDQIELYRAGEGTEFWADLVGTSALASSASAQVSDALEPGDVVIVVPIAPGRSATPLLGDELTLLMRRSGGQYLVHRVVEDFTLPP